MNIILSIVFYFNYRSVAIKQCVVLIIFRKNSNSNDLNTKSETELQVKEHVFRIYSIFS